jgi:hypothetical protein
MGIQRILKEMVYQVCEIHKLDNCNIYTYMPLYIHELKKPDNQWLSGFQPFTFSRNQLWTTYLYSREYPC